MAQDKIDQITIHTDSMIKGFFGEYRWLSNYHVCDVEYGGLVFTSSEAAYQSAKNDDIFLKSRFQEMTPHESKLFSHKIKIRKDWESIKKQVMYDCLKSKFERNQELRDQLIQTGSKYLEETNYWNDTYYGVCNGKGKNILGKLLMQIREELRTDLKE